MKEHDSEIVGLLKVGAVYLGCWLFAIWLVTSHAPV